MLKKLVSLWAALLFMVGVAAGVYLLLGTLGGPLMKPVTSVINDVRREDTRPVVGPYTTVRMVKEYGSCGDVELYSRGPAGEELIGLDEHRLRMRYPASDGWEVAFQDGELTVTRKVEGYCGLHREYRHLGLHRGKLAVYQGPLGNDETLLRVEENIDVQMLPADWRSSLEQAARYNDLPREEQLELQARLEFPDEFTMNMVLENFDEMDNATGA